MKNNDPGMGYGRVRPVFLTRRASVTAFAAAITTMLGAAPAQALQFEQGEIKGNFDTTLSYGALIRAQGASDKLIGIANGGTARSVNGDDGDQNYRAGDLVFSTLKATHDLEVKWRNLGLFVRGTEFFDTQVAQDLEKFGPRGRDRLQTNYEFLDAFVSGRFKVAGERTTGVRIGFQVLNWGESTFIQNGVSIINPFDVSKLRSPNAELREALIPSPILQISQELTDTLSFEAYVQARFDNVLLDPRGSFFSTSDIASDDGDRAVVSFGRRSDSRGPATNPIPPSSPAYPTTQALGLGPFDPTASVWVPRNQDRSPNGAGQFGLATRYLANWLGSTEFGAYYIRYHSRLPLVSALKSNSPNAPGSNAGTTSALTPTPLATPTGQNGSARYFVEYPKNISLIGLSFNTQGPAGVALQGEYTYRPNLPVQRSATELLLTALNLPSNFSPDPTAIAAGAEIRGWNRVDAHQIQATATRLFPQVLGGDQLTVVGEAGYNFLDLKSGVLYEGPGTALPSLQASGNAAAGGSTQNGGYATKHSWGYRAVARLDYLSLLGPINVSPRLAFSHDVKGVGPNFNEGAQALSVGVNMNYQQNTQFDLSYTSFFGGREYCGTDQAALSGGALAAGQSLNYCTAANPNKDRDFIAASISYSF